MTTNTPETPAGGSPRPRPVPRDPRTARMTVAELDRRIDDILAEPTEGLRAEAERLGAAHAVLADALATPQ